MATLSSAGIGSGLDVAALVNQLVAAERAPAAQRISGQQSKLNVQLSALGQFKNALSDLQSKLDALKADGALSALKASSTTAETFTATATSAATAGSYEIEVVALAKAHKLVGEPFAGGATTVLGGGTVEIGVGDKSFTVTLGEDATLADLASRINKAADNAGVTATLVTEENGTRLLLTSTKTGTDHAISVSSTLLSFSEKQAAQDAHIRVEGYDHYAQSNTVSGAISGVTVNLLKAAPDEPGTLTLATDSTAATNAVRAFVNSYNAVINLAAALTRYDAETRTAAALTGDSTVRGAVQGLRNALGEVVGESELRLLADIGITTKTDGTLTLDSARLAEAVGTNREAVRALFAGDNGYVARLGAVVKPLVDTDGQVAAKTDSLKARLKDLTRQQEALDTRMAALEARYRNQFTALDMLITQMQTTSSYLTQQLSALESLRSQ